MDNDRLKVEKDRHEMGKSFARAADDEDMNDQLKVYKNIIPIQGACYLY